MSAELVIDGKAMRLTPQDTRAVLIAIQESRARGKGERSRERTKERDLLVYQLHELGHSDAVIGRVTGITARSVRAAVERVESGRYR